MKIEQYLSEKYGINKNIRESWISKIKAWRTWYVGYNKDFHEYKIFNGKSQIKLVRKSLQMAKKASEDWADLLYNVNCQITVKNEESQAELTRLSNKLSLWLVINQAIEKAFSVGTGALVASVVGLKYNPVENIIQISDETEPSVEYVDAEKIYPISWDGKKCTECAFVTHQTIRGKKYAIVSAHTLNAVGNYVITNDVFSVKTSGELEEIPEEEKSLLLGSFSKLDTRSNKRWFCLLSPAVANNIDTPDTAEYDFPFGISIFANAIDSIKSIDKAFDSLDNEIDIGRSRIFVSEDMCENIEGNKVFDTNDISVYTLPKGFSSEQLLQPVNPALRTAQIKEALETALSAFSESVGMGKDTYSLQNVNMSTAAQVYSSNSELKRKRDKHITKLDNELYDLVDALCYIATVFSNYRINPEGLSIKFDDSMFEDLKTSAERKLREVDMEIASRAEYRKEIYKEDIATAEKAIEEIDRKNMEKLANVQLAQVI